jgi:pyruvate dehydrogenase (quinone)
MNVSDFFWKRMSEWGVSRVYGYPGDGINGLMGGLDRAKDKIDFIQARHEELAAFMACAHAKFTGEVGVCLATSGPGAIHLLNGLYDARLDHQPVVAIVGQQARTALGGHYQQEVDLKNLFKDVAGEFVEMATEPAQVRHVIDRAVRIAKAERAVTCIIMPNDLQEMAAVETPPRAHGTVHSGIGYSAPRVMPADADLRRAADALNAGKKVAMLVGAGALNATDEVIEIADLLGAGIAKALLGKAAVPDDLPYVTGSIGLLGTRPSYEMMIGCDTLLMVGSGFPYSEFLPEEGQARGVQIDIDPKMLSIRYPMEVNLVGDSAATLQALAKLIKRKTDRSWRETIEKNVKEWWKTLEAIAHQDGEPINPQRVFWELSPKLPDRCILVGDSGSGTNWYARDVKLRRGMMGSVSGGLATMGCGVPYAIGAKFAHPDRPVIAMVGDGAMQMNGINGLITISKYWERWSDPRLIVLVGDAHPGRRPDVRGVAEPAGRAFRALCRAGGPQGHLLQRSEQDRGGVGRGACGAQARGARDEDRPGHSAAAAAHHAEAGQGLRLDSMAGRSERGGRHPQDDQGVHRRAAAALSETGQRASIVGASAKRPCRLTSG